MIKTTDAIDTHQLYNILIYRHPTSFLLKNSLLVFWIYENTFFFQNSKQNFIATYKMFSKTISSPLNWTTSPKHLPINNFPIGEEIETAKYNSSLNLICPAETDKK